MLEADDDVCISVSFITDVETRSEEIAKGLSPRTLSINHRWGFEMNWVVLSETASENPSDVSCFCSLATIISETVAARSPVGQSINIAMAKGSRKKRALPNELSRNSSDFRGAISINAPNTSSPTTESIVRGQCRTECVFINHDTRLRSISST